MTTTQSIRSCPQCEQPLPPDAPEGLCPECLMLGGLETMPLPEGYKPTGRLPERGETFGGYRIGAELGRGGMGAVFEAEQLETGRRVALKLLNHQLDSPESRARFLREGRLAASINHPNSVYVFGTEEIGEMPAIVMELVNGGTLEERVKKHGALPVGEAVDAALQIIEGLSAAEEIGILHRDVKPGNCFEDEDGTVKIGDFGLSISTEARDEKHLTMEGAVFGTPAFSSPEQLRGDELNVRSDIYAVGATLFYLLTGRPAFQGRSIAQLFANVLEGPTPSAKEVRPDLPAELVAVVTRCLQKMPAERYGSYIELRKALAPFCSDAPVPAPLLLRLAAGAIDWAGFTGCVALGQVAILGGMAFVERPGAMAQGIVIAASLTFWALYFGLVEGRRGSSVGKMICRLRVVDSKGNPPTIATAMLRSLLILIPPSLPIWIYACVDPGAYLVEVDPLLSYSSLAGFYVILGLLFCGARRRNGFASVGDMLTATRVVRRKRFQQRPVSIQPFLEPVDAGNVAPQLGPFHILEKVNADWSIGYDSRLLRKVWLRHVPAGTPPVSGEIRQMGRVGRLRWLMGRRSDGENWDAFEYPGGRSILALAKKGAPSWNRIRYWLADLAEELETAEKDGTTPSVLSLDRVWISDSGRAKLLDEPVTRTQIDGSEKSLSVGELFEQVAALAEAPIPAHAMDFRKSVASETVPSKVAKLVHPMLTRNITVSTARRFALLLGCIAFPAVVAVSSLIFIKVFQSWSEQEPRILELSGVMSYRTAARTEDFSEFDLPADRLFSIYISSRYGDLISDAERWNGLASRSLIVGSERQFAERSVVDFPSPGAEEIEEAIEAIGEDWQSMQNAAFELSPWVPVAAAVIALLFYVALPAIIASLLFRRGLLMLICGVTVCRKNGERASRLRCLWRSLITWSPVLVGTLISIVTTPQVTDEIVRDAVIASVCWIVLGLISLCLPKRSLQDRLAGTCLVAT